MADALVIQARRARARRLLRAALLGFAVVGVATVLPVTALAQAPAPVCPDRPADYTGGDGQLAELRALRQALADSCAAHADDLAALRSDLATARARLGELHDGLVAGDFSLSARLDRGGTSDTPLFVSGSNVGGAATVGSSAEDPAYVRYAPTDEQPDPGLTVAALRTDVWFLVGLLSTCLLGYGIYRLVMPRA